MSEFLEDRNGIVENLIDEIVPEGLDWERLVVTYPLPAIGLVALGGFFLGFRHGSEILRALSGYVTSEVTRNIGNLMGQEVG